MLKFRKTTQNHTSSDEIDKQEILTKLPSFSISFYHILFSFFFCHTRAPLLARSKCCSAFPLNFEEISRSFRLYMCFLKRKFFFISFRQNITLFEKNTEKIWFFQKKFMNTPILPSRSLKLSSEILRGIWTFSQMFIVRGFRILQYCFI